MPRLLDLFCCQGGASVGYYQAGFDVVGVDISKQPHYPYQFFQADALEFLRDVGTDSFDAVHASPPCQHFSSATKRNGTEDNWPDLVDPTRELLEQTGLPYVIENVVGAPLVDPQLACGTALTSGLDDFRLRRHRLFETNWDLELPACRCKDDPRPVMDVTGGGDTLKARMDGKGGRPRKGNADQARQIMGMPWATKGGCNEAIPPAYTKAVGLQLMEEVRRRGLDPSNS